MPDHNRHSDGETCTFGDLREGWEYRSRMGEVEVDGRAGYG